MKVVADSGPLIALSKLAALHLLHSLYGEVLIPSAVHVEVVGRGTEGAHPDAYAVGLAVRRGCIIVTAMGDAELPTGIRGLPLDAGERQVLHLAIRDGADLVLLDDFSTRQKARELGLTVKGTMGVIVEGYRAGRMSRDDVEVLVHTIMARDDIWIADELCHRVLAGLGE